jgi:hypothetical protein
MPVAVDDRVSVGRLAGPDHGVGAQGGTDPVAELLNLVDDDVHGNVLRSAEMRAAGATPPDDETVEAAVRFAEAQFATGEFPHTQALFAGEDPRTVFPRLIGSVSERDRFRHGLAILLDGAAGRMNLSLPD